MAKNDKSSNKEVCPRCGEAKFAVATDGSNKHYCQVKGCMHVWVPGTSGLDRFDIKIKKLTEENEALKLEIGKVRADNAALKAELETFRTAAGAPEDEIFT